jgi:hypothetical protein
VIGATRASATASSSRVLNPPSALTLPAQKRPGSESTMASSMSFSIAVKPRIATRKSSPSRSKACTSSSVSHARELSRAGLCLGTSPSLVPKSAGIVRKLRESATCSSANERAPDWLSDAAPAPPRPESRSACHAEGRGFEPLHPLHRNPPETAGFALLGRRRKQPNSPLGRHFGQQFRTVE